MNKFMNKKNISIIALVLVAVIGVVLYFNFNNIALRTAEKIGSQALGVDVEIGGLDLALLDQRATVTNVRIANPEGYKGRYIMEIGQIDIGLNSASAELVDFKNIDVKDSVLNVEINENGMNVSDLKKNLSSGSEQSESSAAEAVKVIIEKATINASTINTSVTFLDRDIEPIKMPAVNFSNIGQGGGASAQDALSKIFVKYMSDVQRQVAIDSSLRGVEIPGLPNDFGSAVEGVTENIKNTIKGLFE